MKKLLKIIILLVIELIAQSGFAEDLQLFQANPYLYGENEGNSPPYLFIPIYNSSDKAVITIINTTCTYDNIPCQVLQNPNSNIIPESTTYIAFVGGQTKTTNIHSVSLNIQYIEYGMFYESSINYTILGGDTPGFGTYSTITNNTESPIYFMNCLGAPTTFQNNTSNIVGNSNITVLNNYNSAYTMQPNACVAMKYISGNTESAVLYTSSQTARSPLYSADITIEN